jgi:MATE family multidrug resistance protein
MGCPAWGLEGAAIATLIARIAILIAMFVWLYRAKGLRDWLPYRWLRMPNRSEIGRFLSIGFPASLQMVCEVSAFSIAGLLMGRFGASAMAAHQIALMCAATAFMVPLGLSMALGVRIGSANGAGEFHRLRKIVVSGWWLGAGWSLIGAMIFFFFGKDLAALYIDELPVIELAATMMIVVGVFQLFDSLQIGSVAMLRGLHDARMPAFMGFVAYWVIGIPIGVWLSIHLGYGAVGVWCGLAAGLFVACCLLVPRLWKLTR